MRDEKKNQNLEAEADGLIEGRNAVIEALRAGTAIDKIYLQKGETDATLGHIASSARDEGRGGGGGRPAEAGRHEPHPRPPGRHRRGRRPGVRRAWTTSSNAAREKGEAPLIVVCDELSDPHNLGAVIRTADAAGAHGVIIPKRRSAGLTAVVAKTSAGAVSPSARGPGAQPHRPAQGPEGGGRLGVRHRRRRHHHPLPRRPEGPRRHRHRQRGGRHEPPCPGAAATSSCPSPCGGRSTR